MKKQLAKVFLGEFVAKALQFVFEFMLVRMLAQAELASWVVFSFVLRFSPYASFGCLSYLNKFYPLQSEDVVAQAEIKEKVQQNIFLISVFFFIASFVFAFIFLTSSESVHFDVAMSLFVMSLILQYTFFQSLLRNKFEFERYIAGLLLFCVAQLSAALILYKYFSFHGIYYGILLAYILTILYYWLATKSKFTLALNQFYLDVIKSGLPPFLLTIVSFLFQSIDRIALIIYSNEAFLASYAVFFIFYQLGLILVNTAGKVISPFFLSQADEKKADFMIFGFFLLFTVLYFIFLCCFLLWGGYFLEFFLPNYAHLFKEIFIYLVIGYLVAYSQIYFNELVKRSKEILVVVLTISLSGVGLCVLSYTLFLRSNLNDFVEVSLVVNLVYCVCITILVGSVKNSSFENIFIMCLFPTIATLSVLLL